MRRMRLRGIVVISIALAAVALRGAIYLIENNFDQSSMCMTSETTKIAETSFAETSVLGKDPDVFDINVRKKTVRYKPLNVHTSPILTEDIVGYDNVCGTLEKNNIVYVLDDVSFSDPRTNRLWYYITNEDGSKKGWVVSDGLS